MALLPFRVPPSAEPPAPTTAARQALHDHCAKQTRQHARLHELAQPVRDAESASARLRQAQAALDDITAAEQQRIDAWTQSPGEPMPQAIDRTQALVALAEA